MRPTMLSLILLAAISLGASAAPKAAAINAAAINTATAPSPTAKGVDPALVRAEVLLARAHFSPGVIDGRPGDNLRAAVAAYAQAHSLAGDGKLDAAVLKALADADPAPAIVSHVITADEVKGPFAAAIPKDYAEMAKLDRLAFTSPLEALAEAFHMDEALLKALNPGADFGKAGTAILVAAPDHSSLRSDHTRHDEWSNSKRESGALGGSSEPPNAPGPDTLPAPVAAIEVDKSARQVRAYAADGSLLAAYPATVGSTDRPAPSGDFTVKGVSRDPVYTYDPSRLTFGPRSKGKLTIRPGPNNPVGVVWIDLSIPTYGIHGAPEPKLVGKAASHGCVRLTNWDARQLASAVKPGVKVSFLGEERPAPAAGKGGRAG